MWQQRPILLFDVNETLLDLSPFEPFFAHVFGGAEALREWFNQVVIYSIAMTLGNTYANSSEIGNAVLEMMANARNRVLLESDLAEFRRIASSQPAYADVEPALSALKGNGFRMVTLSNNPTRSTDEALKRNGLFHFFERTFSIDDELHRYKPAPETYTSVAQGLSVTVGDLCLISCHAFDVLGAAAAGLKTTMILRPHNVGIALGTQPDIVAQDLQQAAAALISNLVE